MSTPNDGGPAFPLVSEDRRAIRHVGMTLRDYLAAAALQGLSANPKYDASVEGAAQFAYAQADAMLAERAKTREVQP